MDKTQKEAAFHEFLRIEHEQSHAPYDSEYSFYRAVKNGETEKVRQKLQAERLSQKKLGMLSRNPLQNLKYHFVISVALVARYCVEGGMLHEQAFSLSDFYIQKADACKDVLSLENLLLAMMTDYSQRMKGLKDRSVYSGAVRRCMEYIYDNLHRKIKVSEIADFLKKNESYLSKLFRKETGTSISAYILKAKLEASEKLLLYTEHSLSDIVEILDFSSQSYFTYIFRKKYDCTPRQYRLRKTDLNLKERLQ